MFSIQHTDESNRIATIQIGDFREDFESDSDLSTQELDKLWICELNKLKEAKSVILPVWFANGVVARGWILWKEGDEIYIQDQLFVDQGLKFRGQKPPARETKTEEGFEISEWSVDMTSVEYFLNQKEQIQTQ